MRRLTDRERWLLGICLATLFVMVNMVVMQRVIVGLRSSNKQIRLLTNEQTQQEIWLREGDFEDLERWIDENMPLLESAGKNQGELLQKVQNEVFERKLRLERQSLLEPEMTAYYKEVSINVIVRGQLDEINKWLTSLQKPEDFYVVKSMELALDTNSREKEPQARCNLTLAQWFKPDN